MALANSVRRFEFCALAGVEDVRLEDAGDAVALGELSPLMERLPPPVPQAGVVASGGIEHQELDTGPLPPLMPGWLVGRWKDHLTPFYGPEQRRLVEDFVNWPREPQRILTFTKAYGPLEVRPKPGEDFRYPLAIWILGQKHFRWLWKNLVHFPNWAIPEEQAGDLAYRSGRLVYTAPNLYMFLYLDLVTCPAERLRVCARPDCANPFFIAHHLRQNYCSQICATWGQRQWKLQWWKEHGKQWRAGQRRKQSSAKRLKTFKAKRRR